MSACELGIRLTTVLMSKWAICLRDTSPTRQFTYYLYTLPTEFHIVYALIQLYMYGKNSVKTMDMAGIRTARGPILQVTVGKNIGSEGSKK